MELLVTGAIKLTRFQREKIQKLGYKIIFIPNELEKIKQDVSEVEGVICNALFQYNNIQKFKKLKFIQITSSGLDKLPLSYIKENKINLYTARGVYSVPMAEWAILKILEIYKNSKFFIENQKKGAWNKNRNIQELCGKKVSIIGYGSVGKEIAKRLKGFGTRTVGVGLKEEYSDSYLMKYYHERELEKVIEDSDVVIITLPLTTKTEGLFDYSKMSKMKDDSILINLSRGKIINQKDLVTLLDEGKFSGCGLDVFEHEPLDKTSKIWSFDRVYVTPHISFESIENNNRLFKTIMTNLVKEIT